MNLNSRITRLEQRLQSQPCPCPDNTDLSWPGHQPPPHCATCGGERLIYLLNHHPRDAEAQLRAALPLLAKTHDGSDRPDYSKLTDRELQQVRAALHAHQLEAPEHSTKPQR